MKRLFIIITVLLASVVLFAQQEVQIDINKMFGHNIEIQEDRFESLQALHRINKDSFSKLSFSKDAVLVQDSIEYYGSIDFSSWVKSRRFKVLEHNSQGGILNGREMFYDNVTELWSPKDTITVSYYSNGSEKGYLARPWNSDILAWVDTTYYRELDENGNTVQLIKRNWHYSENQFYDFGYKVIMTYEENGNWIKDLIYKWDVVNEVWKFWFQDIYTYDNNNNLEIMAVQEWADDQGWINESLFTYVYDDNGKIIERIAQVWNDYSQAWFNSNRVLYTYDTNQYLLEGLYQQWANDWQDNFHILYVNDDNGNCALEIQQSWESDLEIWNNSRQINYTFDENNRLVFELEEKWNDSLEMWKNFRQYSNSYDINGNHTQWYNKDWCEEDNVWWYIEKKDYYWSELEVQGVNSITSQNITLFPNPTKEIINIATNLNLTNTQIHIFSIMGTQITSIFMNNPYMINIGELDNGVYFLYFETEEGNMVKKFIKN